MSNGKSGKGYILPISTNSMEQGVERNGGGEAPAYINQQMSTAQPSLQYGLEVEDIISMVKLNLLNKEVDEDGNTVQIEETKPLINVIGLSCLMSRVRSVLNRNTFLSNLSESEYSRVMEQIANEVVLDIGLNWRAWEMKREDRNAVKMSVIQPIMCALKRPVLEGERNYLQPMHRFVERRDVGGEEQRKKRFGIF